MNEISENGKIISVEFSSYEIRKMLENIITSRGLVPGTIHETITVRKKGTKFTANFIGCWCNVFIPEGGKP